MSAKKNLSYNLIYEILIFILPLITAPYISRILKTEGVGIYSYTNSVVYYFILFAMLGMAQYGNRTIARVRENKEQLNQTFTNLYILQLVTSGIVLIMYVGYILFFGSEYKTYFTIQSLAICSVFFDVNWFFFGMEKFKLAVIRSSIIKVSATICVFVFVKTPSDLYLYIAIVAASALLTQLAVFPFLYKHIKFVKPSWREVKIHIKPLIILFIPVIALSMYTTMSKIMIKQLSDVIQTGFFENADKIIKIPLTVITALGTVMLPRMSNLVAQNQESLSKRYIRDSFQFVIAVSVPIMFGLMSVGEIFAPIFFGEEFTETGKLILYLSPCVIFMAIANVVRMQYLLPRGKDKQYLIAILVGATLNVIFNAIFIPHFGAFGAVIATLIAEISATILQIFFTRKSLEYLQYIKDNHLFLVSGAIMYAVIFIVKLYIGVGILDLVVLIGIGIATYSIICLLLFRIFNKERLIYFLRYIKRRKTTNEKEGNSDYQEKKD